MAKKYIFDVDGTLTDSRQHMDKQFAVWFSKFCENNLVYLVTGSDKPKTVEQIGEYIYHKCQRVYQCSGSDVWQGDKNVRTSNWRLPDLARYFLDSCEYESKFPVRTGNHIEERSGMVNFSVVGRNAILTERALYVTWDKAQRERARIVKSFNLMFPELLATSGGETGLDIAPKGNNKSQILVDFADTDELHFFGDAIFPGGNDAPLADAIAEQNRGKSYKVADWNDTFRILTEQVDTV